MPPMSSLVLGDLFEIYSPNIDYEKRDELLSKFVNWVGFLCILMLIFNSLSYGILQAQAEKVSLELRTRYLKTLIR